MSLFFQNEKLESIFLSQKNESSNLSDQVIKKEERFMNYQRELTEFFSEKAQIRENFKEKDSYFQEETRIWNFELKKEEEMAKLAQIKEYIEEIVEIVRKSISFGKNSISVSNAIKVRNIIH